MCTVVLATAGGNIPVKMDEPVVAPVATEATSDWEQKISIYGWLPNFDGKLNYNIPGSGDSVESDFIDKLDMVFMANYEVRKEKWSFLADMIYLNMSDSQVTSVSRLNIPVTAEEELTAWMLSFYGGYNTVNTDKVTLDIIAGLRYLSLAVAIDGTVGTIPFSTSPSVALYDTVIGVKGEVNLNENWYAPYLFDIGGGDSDLTWQASAGIGYRFDWGDVLLTYRYIHYDEGDAKLVENVDMYGPTLGVIFHF